jgi:hypothetical protein
MDTTYTLYSTVHGKVNSLVRDGIPVPRDGNPVI